MTNNSHCVSVVRGTFDFVKASRRLRRTSNCCINASDDT